VGGENRRSVHWHERTWTVLHSPLLPMFSVSTHAAAMIEAATNDAQPPKRQRGPGLGLRATALRLPTYTDGWARRARHERQFQKTKQNRRIGGRRAVTGSHRLAIARDRVSHARALPNRHQTADNAYRELLALVCTRARERRTPARAHAERRVSSYALHDLSLQAARLAHGHLEEAADVTRIGLRKHAANPARQSG
jgi:hypothetical protein